MSEVKFPKWFHAAFATVTQHFGCDSDEIELMKQLARADKEAAMDLYRDLAQRIRGAPVKEESAIPVSQIVLESKGRPTKER